MAVNPELFLKSFQIFGENRRENVKSNIALGTFQRQARVSDETWDWYQRYKDNNDTDFNNALRDMIAFEMNQVGNNDLDRIPGPPAAQTATATTETAQPRPDGTPAPTTAGQPSSSIPASVVSRETRDNLLGNIQQVTTPSVKGVKGQEQQSAKLSRKAVVRGTLNTGLAVRDEQGRVIPMQTNAGQTIDVDTDRITGDRIYSPSLGGTVIRRGVQYEEPATNAAPQTATEDALSALGALDQPTELPPVTVTATRDNTSEGLVDMSVAPQRAAEEGAQRAAYSPVRMNPALQGLIDNRRAAENELMEAARRAGGNAAQFAQELRSISSRYRGIPTQMFVRAWDAAMNAPPVTLTDPFSGMVVQGRADRLQQTMNVVDHVQRVSNERTKNQLEAARLEAAAREVELGAETAYLKLRHANTVDQQAAFEKAQAAMEALATKYAMSGTNVEVPSSELMKVQQILAAAGIEDTDLITNFDNFLDVNNGKYFIDAGFMQEVSDSILPRTMGTFRAAGEAYIQTGVSDFDFEESVLTEDERAAVVAGRNGDVVVPAMLQAIGSKWNAYKGGRLGAIDNINEENRFVTSLSETLQAAGLHSALAWNGTTYDYNTFVGHIARVDAAFNDQSLVDTLDPDEWSMYDRSMAMAYRTHRGMPSDEVRRRARTYLSMAKSYLLNELNSAAARNNYSGYSGFSGTGTGTGVGTVASSGDREMQEQIGLERLIQRLGNINRVDDVRMTWLKNNNQTVFDNMTGVWKKAEEIFLQYPEASRSNNANFRAAVRQIKNDFSGMSSNDSMLFVTLPKEDVERMFLGGQRLDSANIDTAFTRFKEWMGQDPSSRERFLQRLIGRSNPAYDKYIDEPARPLNNSNGQTPQPAATSTALSGEAINRYASTAVEALMPGAVQIFENNKSNANGAGAAIGSYVDSFLAKNPTYNIAGLRDIIINKLMEGYRDPSLWEQIRGNSPAIAGVADAISGAYSAYIQSGE